LLCNRVRKSLHRYVAGETSKLEDKLIKEHLDSCDSCKLEYERIVEIKSILSQIGRNVEAPPGLIANIMGSIDLDKYKSIGVYAINNIRSLGLSLIAAGLIIALFNLSPHRNHCIIDSIGKNMGNIQNSIIKPFEMMNNNIMNISDRIFNLNMTMDEDD